MLKDQAAAHYLSDVACDVLFHHPGPMRWLDLLQRVATLAPVDAAMLETVLAADERFTQPYGRWDLAPRPLVGSRPLGGALAALLQCFGKAMSRPLLVAELCLTRAGAPAQMDELLTRLLASGRDLGVLGDCIYLTTWLPSLGTTDPQALLFVNDLTDDQGFLAVHSKLLATKLRQRQLLDTTEAILKAAHIPLHNRALGLVLHAHHGERFKPPDVFSDMHSDERFLCLSGPAWVLRSQERAWLKALAPTSGGTEAPERPVDATEILQSPPPPRLKLDADALAGLHQFAAALRTPVAVAEGVQEVLGLRPRQRNYPAAVHAVDTALGADLSLSRLRPGTYLCRAAIPPWVTEVPEAVRPQHGPLTPDQDAEALLPIAELPPELAAHVLNAVYEDVGETKVTVAEEPMQETHLAIPWHHHQCGTMMLRQRDRRLLDLPATLTMLTLEAPAGECLPVWANTQTSLLYGLLAWYYENLPPSGAVVTLRRSDRPDALTLEYSDQVDSAARIGEERLEHLLHLRDRLQRRPTSTAETVVAVLHGQPRGFTFDQLWFQLNIVRRTTRHQLASTLMLAEQLQQTDNGRWQVA
jgi:hypothetical protein